MMADKKPPTLHLVLVPRTNETGEVISLSFSLSIQNLSVKGGDFLCAYGRRDDAHASRLQHYLQGIPATIRDDEGLVPFILSGEDVKEARVTRDVIGDITIASDFPALGADESSSDDDDVSALRRDHGGLIGAGRYFLPQLDLGSCCHILVEWDLSGCPAGTRAVSSFGEGPGPVEVVGGGSEMLLDCVFMVGLGVQSFPPPANSPREPTGTGLGATTYWVGELPENLDAVKDYAAKIFPRMAEHFADERGSCCAFLRRTPNDLKGTVFGSSAIIDYDSDTKDENDWDLVRLLNMTMVSTWARLDSEDDGTVSKWFTDGKVVADNIGKYVCNILTELSLGLSHLYSVFLPFRFGQRGPDYFRATMNAFLSAYFTNPLVKTPLAELQRLDPSEEWYVTSALATRACLYMLKMDTYTRRAAVSRGVDIMRPMDELIRDLLPRRRRGEKIQKKHWLQGIAYWCGEEDAERYFREMLEEGNVNELDDMLSSFGAKFGPQPVEQEVLEFGFDRKSLDNGVVDGVVEGSRAWEAGLRDGDRLLWCSRPESCGIHHDEKFKLTVDRDGREVEIEYWPRSKTRVGSWQVLERPKPEV